MKKLFFAALAVAALASCTQSETIEENASTKKAMTFDEAYIGKTTRATPITGNTFADQSTMGVFCKDNSSPANVVMDNQKVLFDAGAWIYTPQKFYTANVEYTFDAYTPYRDGVASINDVYTDYVVNTDVTKQEDLMYAQTLSGIKWDGQPKSIMKPIQFTFKHALTQVKFSARTIQDYTGYYDLKIQKIVLKGVNSKSTFSRSTESWNAPTTPVEYTMTTDQALTQSMDVITTVDNDIFMLIPQKWTSDLTVEITIDVQDAAGHTPDPTVTKGAHTITATIPALDAADPTATGWLRNHVYNYQLNLDLDQILNMKSIIFANPIVEDWAPEENIPSVVTPVPAP